MQDESKQRRIGEAGPVPRSSDRIWLEVALLTGASEAARGAEAMQGSDGSDGATAMVVAHDADLRAYIRDCLSAAGLRILDAADLASARATLEGQALDLLILDLPSLEAGPEDRAAQWPSMGELPSVPLVLITDEPLSPGLVEWVATGRAAVVVKPFNARRLQEKVANCLGGRPMPGDAPGGIR